MRLLLLLLGVEGLLRLVWHLLLRLLKLLWVVGLLRWLGGYWLLVCLLRPQRHLGVLRLSYGPRDGLSGLTGCCFIGVVRDLGQ